MNDTATKIEISENDIDLSGIVRQAGVLVACKTHKWGATTTDKKATKETIDANNADQDAGKFVKNLLAGADAEYKQLCKSIRRVYNVHTEMTTQWADDGSGNRLLANRRTFEYAQKIEDARNDVRRDKKAFGAVYATRRVEALAKLGNMADPNVYPTEEEILSRFGVEIVFNPIPDGSDYSALPENLAKHLATQLNQRMEGMVENAMGDAFKRLGSTIQKMSAVLKNEEQMKFKSTLVQNIRDMVELARDFNLTGNTVYSEVLDRAEEELCQWDHKALKNSIGRRREVAKKADDILAKMAEFGL